MQTRPKLGLLLAAAAVSIGVSVSAAHASPIPIDPSPTLTVAGNTFSNFTCSLTGNGTPTSCGQINVGADPLNNGIELSSGFTALPGQFTDAALSYSVSGTTPISGIDLSFNGTFAGFAISSVTETAIDPTTGNHVGFLKVDCGLIGGCTQIRPSHRFPEPHGWHVHEPADREGYQCHWWFFGRRSDQHHRPELPQRLRARADVAGAAWHWLPRTRRAQPPHRTEGQVRLTGRIARPPSKRRWARQRRLLAAS